MDWISIGKITKTHGLRGELKFHPSMDETWIVGIKQARLSFKNPLEDFADYNIQSIRGKDRPFIIKFQGVDSIEIASNLSKKTLDGHTFDAIVTTNSRSKLFISSSCLLLYMF